MAQTQKRRSSPNAKRYMSNTDKSIYNLTYVLSNANKPSSPKRPPAVEVPVVTRRTISYDLLTPMQQYYYPFAYPTVAGPVQSRRVTPSWLDSQIDRKERVVVRVDQRNQALNLFDGKKRHLKVERHYVTSSEEAEDLIAQLKEKGFIPAEVQSDKGEND